MKAQTIKESMPKQTTRPASDTKAHWREIVADANTHGEVFVTHYNRPQVVVVSLARYSKLNAEAVANDPLTKLRAEFENRQHVHPLFQVRVHCHCYADCA